MTRGALLAYKAQVPLPVVLGHDRFRSLCKTGQEPRRTAAWREGSYKTTRG
jgi:hypothetical protein